MKKTIAYVIAPVAALIIIACGAPSNNEVAQTPDDTSSASVVAAAPSKATTKAAPAIAADTLVHVGEDVPAGTYRAITGADGDCYWKKSSDSEGQDIIANDIVKGGRPQVNLAKGQWFVSEHCGAWAKR